MGPTETGCSRPPAASWCGESPTTGTAFIDGYMTWINGPYGIQQRLDTDRFPWENDDRSTSQVAPPAVAPLTPVSAPAPAPQPTPAPKAPPAPTPAPAEGPMVFSNPNIYHAKSPEYGMFVFLMGYPNSADRDLELIKNVGFSWGKTLIQWGQVEAKAKGQYDWSQTDMAVESAAREGIRLIARVDDTPSWARADHKNNAPPDNYADYGDFLNALVNRYKTGSPYGHIDAIEVWNEPNLTREWGDVPPNAAEYTKLLAVANNGVKMADPSVLVLTAGLSPTGTNDATAIPDDVFLQQMYDAGARGCFDVLGAHAAGYKAPPEMSPDQVAADPNYGGNRVFTFRRVEDLRNVMVRNGDAGKQVWLAGRTAPCRSKTGTPRQVAPRDQGYQPTVNLGRRANGVAASKAAAARRTAASAWRRPTICIPTGSPAAVKPQGIEIAGRPVMLME